MCTTSRKSISTQRVALPKLVILEVFCLFSHSPTFEDKHYLDEDELQRDVIRIRLYYWKRGYRETEVDTAVTPIGDEQGQGHVQGQRGPPTRRARGRHRRTTRR